MTAAPAGTWPAAEAILLRALRSAPRRYRLPPLPADPAAAVAAGTDVALAFAIEARRTAPRSAAPADSMRELFTRSLAQAIVEASDPVRGDPAFQAMVLQADDDEVAEYVRLAAQSAADRRTVRLAIASVAHPAKLNGVAPGAPRERLARLHRLAAAQSWSELRGALQAWLAQHAPGDATRDRLAVLAAPALVRLERGDRLVQTAAVQRWRALCDRRGPLAGSAAAASRGRASARAGDDAEAATADVLREVAARLDALARESGACRTVRQLRAPRGWPGPAANAKQEWDAAIVHSRDGGPVHDIVLLAEVKASPAAAVPDWPRLIRGLQRLAHADPAGSHGFETRDGRLLVAGASLRRLQPHGRELPPHVIYCCRAPTGTGAGVLSPVAKWKLLAEPASVAFARRLARGAGVSHDELLPVWEALACARLRGVLHQWETAESAREAMLDPQDLLHALRQA